MITSILNTIVGVSVAIALGVVSFLLFRDSSPTMLVLDQEVLTPVIHQGEKLRIRYTIVKYRVCPTEARRFIFDADGSVVSREIVSPAGASGLGNSQPVIAIDVPPQLPPGAYTYRVLLVVTCGLYTQTLIVPNASFEIK